MVKKICEMTSRLFYKFPLELNFPHGHCHVHLCYWIRIHVYCSLCELPCTGYTVFL